MQTDDTTQEINCLKARTPLYAASSYDTGINILGSIPDMTEVIRFVNAQAQHQADNHFQFRSDKSTKRFVSAIHAHVMQFAGKQNKQLFLHALACDSFTLSDKYLVLFWQLTYTNLLFRRITADVLVKVVAQGRQTLTASEILNYLHFLKETEATSIRWSESTQKTVSSKYLTLLRKLGLAEGTTSKRTIRPVISNQLFVYFIRWTQSVCPNNHTLDSRTLANPYLPFCFFDEQALTAQLKKVENIAYWNITQIGTNITIDLKDDSDNEEEQTSKTKNDDQ